jgi:ornithine cyclodeaminase/alanine dehydrogenase-like protein (mu-crystallin family)
MAMSTGGPIVLADGDVVRLGDMDLAIAAIETALKARAGGKFVAPPRQTVAFPGFGNLIFTNGGSTGDPAIAGFRVRNTFDPSDVADDQITAVWNMTSARLEGLLLGPHVGAIRTGAIGGVAIKYMARSDASTAAVIGTGPQAATQIEAAARVLKLRHIRVFSRAAERRAAFAKATELRTGVATAAAASAEEAVGDADIVILATTSKIPVILASWLKAGVHINTLGPRVRNRSEVGTDVVERASLIATDSPEQIAALSDPYFLAGTAGMERLVDLAGIVAGRTSGRQNTDAVSLFCSVGLAGTEVMVAAAILAAAKREQAS